MSDTTSTKAKRRLFAAPESRAFFAWSAGSYAVITLILLVETLRTTDGRMIYALDDPAIHLSIASNLVHHGTWGVVPGHFESASSSPLWTVLLGVFIRAFPFAEAYAALVLNAVAALVILAILARLQRTFHPGPKRPLDVLATITIGAVVLFLPGATFVGMEHLLHLALLLAAVHGLLDPRPDRGLARRVGPYVLLGLAAVTRLETAFVALALGTALLALCLRRTDGEPVPAFVPQLRRVVVIGLSAGVPLALYMAFNKAMGQGWLPNSVAAKSATLNGTSGRSPDIEVVLNRFTSDPLLSFVTVACLLLAVAGWPQRRSWFVPALTMVLTTAAQVTFAQVGWYERYQVYLLGLGAYALLLAGRELLPRPGESTSPAPGLRYAALLVLPVLLLSYTKIDLTVQVPTAANDTYQQRYQAAEFLARYYQDRPVATGELGYISLEHRGPLTDLLGLGDYEVLEARKAAGQRPGKEYWRDLAVERGFPVAALYPTTLFFDTPTEWVLVGTWTLPRKPITAYDRKFQFWATVPEEVAPLIDHLEAYESELPGGVTLEINELAELRADELIRTRDGG